MSYLFLSISLSILRTGELFIFEYFFAGKAIAGLYFKISRYKVWKMHQNTSVTDIDFTAEEAQEQSADKTAARRTKSDPVL